MLCNFINKTTINLSVENLLDHALKLRTNNEACEDSITIIKIDNPGIGDLSSHLFCDSERNPTSNSRGRFVDGDIESERRS